jgi:hypothetical protein
MILKFLLYFLMYIIVPILIFDQIIDPILLLHISDQTINSFEIRVFLKILIIYIYYKVYKIAVSILFGRLRFNLKNEWINYLTFNGWKIKYYKKLLPWVNILNDFNSSFFKATDLLGDLYTLLNKASTYGLVFLVYFLGCSLVCAHYEKRIFGFNVSESEILRNYAKNFNIELANLITFLVYSLILTSFTLLLLGFL